MINKNPDSNNIWMDVFYKKTDTRRCIPFNFATPNNARTI